MGETDTGIAGPERRSGTAEIGDKASLLEALRRIAEDIRVFIELSLQESDYSWQEWLPMIVRASEIRCWERKNCGKRECPSYENSDGRCWLVSGTMCGGEVQGKFAQKYKNCSLCDVYQEAVFSDPAVEIYEHLITLVHSLKTTQSKLLNLATKDMLTGLYNRNYFNEAMARETARAKRFGEQMSVLIIDVDGFKSFNDNFGHLHGDGILRECAKILKKSVRESDFLCRFGGDEFVIVSPRHDCGDNKALMARIEEHVSDWNRDCASDNYRVSFSVGCAVWNGRGDILDTIKAADLSMYESKRNKKTPR
jgi:diguanylate cyclase (GGDEF)-like protein